MVSNIKPLLVPLNDGFRVIGVGRTKGYQLIDEGKIQMVKVGKKSLVVVASLEAFADNLIAQAV